MIRGTGPNPYFLVADARDGLGLYKVFNKTKKKHSEKVNKLKIELCAVTPFGMALNPMVASYIKEDSQMLRFICTDTKGDLKMFGMQEPAQGHARKPLTAITDMNMSSVTTHTGISLIRKFTNYENQLIAFDITGQMMRFGINSDIGYEVAESLGDEKAVSRAREECIPKETTTKGRSNSMKEENTEDIVIVISD